MRRASELSRLLRPRSVAVFGGRWADKVIRQCLRSGFTGSLWRVHPRPQPSDLDGDQPVSWVSSVSELPGVPDAAFLAIDADATITTVGQLAALGCGGAVCFASGFAELAEGGEDRRSAALLDAAQGMPLLGPNCYGYLNLLDGAALWPDQQPVKRCERGAAFISQSGNLAVNFTLQQRGLPMAYVCTVGNQLDLGAEQVLMALLDDPRVSAIGIYLEGIRDGRQLRLAAERALAANIPVVVIKGGRTAQAADTAAGHTAALAGDDAVFDSFCRRYRWARVWSIAELVESLKLLHIAGPLPGQRIGSLSCSGGEAVLMSDLAEPLGLQLPPLSAAIKERLGALLGPRVRLSNPLDYHTFVWGDEQKLTGVYRAMLDGPFDAVVLLLDFPDPMIYDTEVWWAAPQAARAAARDAQLPLIVIANLPESMPAPLRTWLLDAGIAPLQGLTEGLQAIASAVTAGTKVPAPSPLTIVCEPALVLPDTGEIAFKQWLNQHYGLTIPVHTIAAVEHAWEAANQLGGPVVLKSMAAIAHKTDAGAVHLNLRTQAQVEEAARALKAWHDEVAIEAMIGDIQLELLVGIHTDQQFGPVLTLGLGGTRTQWHARTYTLVLPASRGDVMDGLEQLGLDVLLQGYRGAPPCDGGAAITSILALAQAALDLGDALVELEVNPLAVRSMGHGALVLDALLRLR